MIVLTRQVTEADQEAAVGMIAEAETRRPATCRTSELFLSPAEFEVPAAALCRLRPARSSRGQA